MENSGFIIEKNRITSAFILITFLINELIIENKIIEPPVDIEQLEFVDEQNFNRIRHKIITEFQYKKRTVLSFEESLMLYVYVDIACKCFISDLNHILKNLARRNMNIDEDLYAGLRRQYLITAERILSLFNRKYEKNKKLIALKDKLANAYL